MTWELHLVLLPSPRIQALPTCKCHLSSLCRQAKQPGDIGRGLGRVLEAHPQTACQARCPSLPLLLPLSWPPAPQQALHSSTRGRNRVTGSVPPFPQGPIWLSNFTSEEPSDTSENSFSPILSGRVAQVPAQRLQQAPRDPNPPIWLDEAREGGLLGAQCPPPSPPQPLLTAHSGWLSCPRGTELGLGWGYSQCIPGGGAEGMGRAFPTPHALLAWPLSSS